MNVDAIDRDVKRFRSESVRRGAPASLEGLAPVPHDVLARKLGTNAVRVLCLLVELSSAEGIAWPSKSWLAGRLDMGKGSLDRALARLKLFLLVIPKRRVFVPSEKKSVYGWEMLVTLM